jgi:hypothetical protein
MPTIETHEELHARIEKKIHGMIGSADYFAELMVNPRAARIALDALMDIALGTTRDEATHIAKMAIGNLAILVGWRWDDEQK